MFGTYFLVLNSDKDGIYHHCKRESSYMHLGVLFFKQIGTMLPDLLTPEMSTKCDQLHTRKRILMYCNLTDAIYILSHESLFVVLFVVNFYIRTTNYTRLFVYKHFDYTHNLWTKNKHFGKVFSYCKTHGWYMYKKDVVTNSTMGGNLEDK